MKVRAREIELAAAPAGVKVFATEGQVFVESGKVYAVHSMAVFSGELLLQVVDDLGYPSWLPSWLFEIDEPSIPSNWVCTLSQEEPRMIQGPAFIAGSLDAYSRMVELDAEQVELFWAHIEANDRAVGV